MGGGGGGGGGDGTELLAATPDVVPVVTAIPTDHDDRAPDGSLSVGPPPPHPVVTHRTLRVVLVHPFQSEAGSPRVHGYGSQPYPETADMVGHWSVDATHGVTFWNVHASFDFLISRSIDFFLDDSNVCDRL